MGEHCKCGKSHGSYGCGGNCECDRKFLTKEEKVEMLKEYKDTLNKELKGVSETIEELEKK